MNTTAVNAAPGSQACAKVLDCICHVPCAINHSGVNSLGKTLLKSVDRETYREYLVFYL